jgi:TPR repeat protein
MDALFLTSGDPDAQFALGLLYESGKDECEQNAEMAFHYFEASAAKGMLRTGVLD